MVVIQHGEKVREPGDPGLTEQGRHQALVTARFVAEGFGPAAVWASPSRRAVDTATPLAALVGCVVRVDERLRERMNWEGTHAQTLGQFLSEWNRSTSDRSFIPTAGDSSEQAAARFIAAMAEIVDVESTDTVAVVTHGGVTVDTLRTIVGDRLILDHRPELMANGVPCGAVTVLEQDRSMWCVAQLPSVEHLDAPMGHRPA